MSIVLLLAVTLFLLACSSTEQAALEEPEAAPPAPAAPVPYFGQTSLEERIASHQVVVRGTLDRTTSEVVAATGSWRGQYAIAIKFHLSVSEYLRGSGADNVIAVWGSSAPYDTEQEAEVARPGLVDARPTMWDDLEAVFFLHDDTYAMFSALEAPDAYFIGYGDSFDHDDGFSLNSDSNRTWLPAVPDGGSSGSSRSSGASQSSDGDQQFMLGSPTQSPPSTEGAGGLTEVVGPTLTLQRIRDLVRTIDAEIAEGDGTDEYAYCVETKYSLLREDAYLQSDETREPLYSPRLQPTSNRTPTYLQSGSFGPPTKKTLFTIDGDDADMFTVTELPVRAVYNNVSVFNIETKAKRPLRAGTYNFHSRYTHYSALPCAEHPLLSYEVEHTVESDNVYEAYFDPAEWSDVRGAKVVGHDGDKGSLAPKTFTYGNNRRATLHSIRWQDGFMHVHIEPYAPFRNRTIGIVKENSGRKQWTISGGSVIPNENTLTYRVVNQPFEAGEKLLLFYR